MEANHVLQDLQMKEGQWLTEFEALWDMLVFQASMEENNSLAFSFVHALPARLQAETKCMHPKPTNYQEWWEMVREANQILNHVHYKLNAFETWWSQSGEPLAKSVGATTDPANTYNLAVDQLSLQERTRRMRNNLCLRCGRSGHFAKRCANAPFNPPGPRNGPQQSFKRTIPTNWQFAKCPER